MPFGLIFLRITAALIALWFTKTAVQQFRALDLTIGGGSRNDQANPLADISTSSFFDDAGHVSPHEVNDHMNLDQTDQVHASPYTDYDTTEYVYIPPRTEHVIYDPQVAMRPKTGYHDPTSPSEQIENTITDVRGNKEYPLASLPHQESIITLTGTGVCDSIWNSRNEEKDSEFEAGDLMVYRAPPSSNFVSRWITEPFENVWKMWGSRSFLHDMIILGLCLLLGVASGKLTWRRSKDTLIVEYNAILEFVQTDLRGDYEAKLENEKAYLIAEYEPKIEEQSQLAEDITELAGRRIGKLETDLKYERQSTQARYESMLAREKELEDKKKELETNKEELRIKLRGLEIERDDLNGKLRIERHDFVEAARPVARLRLAFLDRTVKFLKLAAGQRMRAKLIAERTVAKFVIRCLKAKISRLELQNQYAGAPSESLDNIKERTTEEDRTQDKALVQEKDEKIRSLTDQIERKDTDVAKLKVIIDKQNKELDEKDVTINNKSGTIADQTTIIDKQSSDLDRVSTAILNRDKIVAGQRATIDNQKKSLSEKDADISNKDRTIADQKMTIENWQDVADAHRKEGIAKESRNKMSMQKEIDCLKELDRLKRESTEMFNQKTSLEDELQKSRNKITWLERMSRELAEHLKVCPIFQAGSGQASKKTELQDVSAKANIEVEQKLHTPESEMARHRADTEAEVQTGNTGESKAASGASETMLNKKSEPKVVAPDTQNARPDDKPKISSSTDCNEKDLLALQAEVRNTSQMDGVQQGEAVGSNTIDFTETPDQIDATGDNNNGGVQQLTTGKAADTNDQGDEKAASDQTTIKLYTDPEPRKQRRHRGIRSPCLQCKFADIECDKHKIPCNNCFENGFNCSRELPGPLDPPSQLLAEDSSKPVKPTKLAIKLKEDCKLDRSLEEIQRLINAKVCPICANGPHKASECPENPTFSKKGEAKDDTKKDDTQKSTAAAPGPVALAPSANTGTTDTTPQSQAPSSRRRTYGPMIVGLSDSSDGSPTETKDLHQDTGKSLRQSKWGDNNSTPAPTLMMPPPPTPQSAVDPRPTSTLTSPFPALSPMDSAQFRRGQNPTAPAFTPSRPSLTDSPVTMPPLPPRGPRNSLPGYRDQPPTPKTPQTNVYIPPHRFSITGSNPATPISPTQPTSSPHRQYSYFPDPQVPTGSQYTNVTRGRGSSRGRSPGRGLDWGRGRSSSSLSQTSAPGSGDDVNRGASASSPTGNPTDVTASGLGDGSRKLSGREPPS